MLSNSDLQLPVDSTEDVRTTLAQLTARARRLIDGDSASVSLNSRGVYEVSKRTAEAIRNQADGANTSSPGSQASVELFMARNFGFDLQEQQRVINQLQRNHLEAAMDTTPVDINSSSSLHGITEPSDVEAVVDSIKNRIISQAHSAVYQKEQEEIQNRNHDLLKSAWKSYYMSVSDDFDGLSTFMEKALHEQTGLGLSHQKSSSRTVSSSELKSSNYLKFLSSDSPIALEINKAIAAYANVVVQHPPIQWVSHFTSYAVETGSCSGNDMGILWATVKAILHPVIRMGSGATFLSYVSASREVIESKFRNRLLTNGIRVDPSRVEEFENVPADRVYELIQRSAGGNPWCHVYTAMKAGRYDVAAQAARQIGAAALEEGLQKLANASPMERQKMPAIMSLRLLYGEEATNSDPFRKTVLFVLLAGRTAQAEREVENALVELSSKVSSSLEDMLWLRLVCIRTQEETSHGGKVQSLTFMQEAILDDLQDLIEVVHGSVPRLASFLFHALLPSTSLRLLIENTVTHVDGVHMALCFNACNLLQQNSLESSFDLESHLSRYCGMILMSNDNCVSKERQQAGAATFSYFHKSGFSEAFAEFCQKDAICSRLFGEHTRLDQDSGILLQATSGVQPELWKAMRLVSETAVRRNHFTLALHMLISIAQAVFKSRGPHQEAFTALASAVQIACPALSQILYLPMHTSEAGSVIAESAHILGLLHQSNNPDIVSRTDYESLRTLCAMSEVYTAVGNGHWELALGTFFQLPFVPKNSTSDKDELVRAYCSASPHVIAAGGAIIPLAFRAATHLLNHYHQHNRTELQPIEAEQYSTSLREQMQLVASWVRCLCSQVGQTFSEVPEEIYEFEERYL